MKLALILMIALTPMASSRRIQSKVGKVFSTENKEAQDNQDLLVKDWDKEMTVAKTEEKDAQGDYEQMMKDSAAKRADDSKTLADKQGTLADLEASLQSNTEACPARVTISGAESVQPGRMGTFVKTDITPISNNGQRPIYQKGSDYLFYLTWNHTYNLPAARWMVGPDYSKFNGWLVSGHDGSGHDGSALCPNLATAWRAYDGSSWLSSYAISVTEATLVPGYTCESDKNYLGETTCFNCPVQNVASVSACADLCDAQIGCHVFLHNKYGECYMKSDKKRVVDDAKEHQTLSCEKVVLAH